MRTTLHVGILMAVVGVAAATEAACFVDKTVVPSDRPYMSSLAPSAVVAGGPAFTLTVNGYGFLPTDIVSWQGAPKTTTFVSAQQLRAQIDASDVVQAKMVPVAVYRAGATSPTYDELWLFVRSSAP
jgi:hypothetical protein